MDSNATSYKTGQKGDSSKDNIEQITSYPLHGLREFKSWTLIHKFEDHKSEGLCMLSEGEESWLEEALSKAQPDALGGWLKKTSKGRKKGKLPRLTQEKCLILRRWLCNASRNCGCKAEVLLVRQENGCLCLLQKGAHNHEQHVSYPKCKKQPLPWNIQVELAKYVDSDIIVPKIMQQLETSGFNVEGLTKTRIKNFLVYQRRKLGSRGTLDDVRTFVCEKMYSESVKYNPDDVFIIDSNIPNDVDEDSFFKDFKISFSCSQMVHWARNMCQGTCPRQLTIDATFKIIVDDKLILMASGITDANGHWFPVLYSLVPCESQCNTLFHLCSMWKLLKDDARPFFEGCYVLKDAGAGIHAGVNAFSKCKHVHMHQQDCYAHLTRVDGNLQQACKKFHISAHIASTFASAVKQISFSPTKACKEALLEKLNVEYRMFKEFMSWWKRTYGGPFKYWARCDSPPGYPVSNQGHESNNKTFKKIHMPSRSTQRRLGIHQALAPLIKGISSLVREKCREYTFTTTPSMEIPQKLWEDVDMLLTSSDWSFRQEEDSMILLPSKALLNDVHSKAQTIAKIEMAKRIIHSSTIEETYLVECEAHMHHLLAEEAKEIVAIGIEPTQEETLFAYFARRSRWTIIGRECTCYAFMDKNVCKHFVALEVHRGNIAFPDHLKVMQKSRHEQLRMHYLRDLTRKQKETIRAGELRKKRYKIGILELQEASQSNDKKCSVEDVRT